MIRRMAARRREARVPLWRSHPRPPAVAARAVVMAGLLSAPFVRDAWPAGPALPGDALTADLSLVQTAGNSSAGTLGLKISYKKDWRHTSLALNAGMIRTRVRDATRRAIGTSPEDWRLDETSVTRLSADSDIVDAHLTRRVDTRWHWLLGGSWTRDAPAGVRARYVESAGLGFDAVARPNLELKLSAAATFTQETAEVANPGAKSTFPGLRLRYSYRQKVTESTSLLHSLVYDQPFSPFDDFRIDAQAGAEIAIVGSGALALKANARLQYDNRPALEELELFATDGQSLGSRVTRPLGKLDTQVTVSIIVNIARKGESEP